MQHTSYIDQIRWLTRALVCSGTLNIALIVLFFYTAMKDSPPQPYFELKPAAPLPSHTVSQATLQEILQSFSTLSLEQLIQKLSHKEPIEEGYTERDLALAALVAFYQLDIGRALGGPPLQQRVIALQQPIHKESSPVTVFLYPGLSEEQYHTLAQFALTERWPFTSEGLFQRIQRSTSPPDDTLLDAFFLTPEFLTVYTLIQRGEGFVDKGEVAHMLRQGSWTILADFATQQRITLDLTPARRQKLLMEYIAQKSIAAAYILLQTDYAFALHKLKDADTLKILTLLTHKTDSAEKYALNLLTSPRSDPVWQAAAYTLYTYAGEPPPEKQIRLSALARFEASSVPALQPAPPPKKFSEKFPEKSIPSAPQQGPPKQNPPPPPVHLYVVQEGDSLWKIARRFHLDVDTLKSHNKLQSDLLKPGITLKIPHKEHG